jgi:hypothetical protein
MGMAQRLALRGTTPRATPAIAGPQSLIAQPVALSAEELPRVVRTRLRG